VSNAKLVQINVLPLGRTFSVGQVATKASGGDGTVDAIVASNTSCTVFYRDGSMETFQKMPIVAVWHIPEQTCPKCGGVDIENLAMKPNGRDAFRCACGHEWNILEEMGGACDKATGLGKRVPVTSGHQKPPRGKRS